MKSILHLVLASLLFCACHSEPAKILAPATEPVPPTLRIAVCQILCVDGDLEGNLGRVEAALQEAVRQEAQIACFPETALLGWVNPDAHQLADPIPGRATERLQALARASDVMIAIGLAEKAGECLHDSCVLIDRDGTLLLTHRKVNILTELMDPPYTPGPVKQLNVVDTRYGRIGMVICADTFKDEIVAAAAEQLPDLLVVPYGWAAAPEQWPQHGEQLTTWVTHTARRAGCAVVGVDLVGEITHGPWTGLTYGGQSIVSDRAGKAIATLGDRVEEVRIVVVEVGRE